MTRDSLSTGGTGLPACDPERLVRAEGLLAPGRPVLVMLSGGRDSTALLDLAVRITGGEHVSALHVNYGLRGEAAAEDEAHCRQLCRQMDVPLHVHRPLGRPVGNVQAWARRERYGAAAELTRTAEHDVAAGHTATDQVETILYRLASSPSRRALLGMASRDVLPGHACRLVRPLLRLTREQTAAYCMAQGLSWREDASNETDAFARGRARTNLVPALRALHPAAERNVLALAEILRAEAEVLDELVVQALEGRGEIPLVRLRALPPAVRALVVQRLADEALGRPAPGAARRAADLAALGPHASLDLPHGVRATVTRGVLRVVLREAPAGDEPGPAPTPARASGPIDSPARE